MKLQADGASTLAAGAAVVDITPPLEVGLLMSSVEGQWAPFVGVRKPLFARAIVLEGTPSADPLEPSRRVAIVSLDLLALSGKAFGGFASFKSRIAVAADGVVGSEEILLACTHTHTAPESAAITELYETDAFRQWSQSLTAAIGHAIASAAATMVPCTLSYGTATAPGLGIHRRIRTTFGIMMSHPAPPEEIVISRDGPVDDSVNVLWFSDQRGTTVATVINATCHPVYEMCHPEISPDYPGELCALVEADQPQSVALFLNGAAGNINPSAVSEGAAPAGRHAECLYAAVKSSAVNARVETNPVLALSRRAISVPSRAPDGLDRGRYEPAELAALRLGTTALAFLPGEPFVETGNAIRQQSPFRLTGIVGFAEETIGYIPTDRAFAEGGYEIGYGAWSHLGPGCEPIVRESAIALLHETASANPAIASPGVIRPNNQVVDRASIAMTGQTTSPGSQNDDE